MPVDCSGAMCRARSRSNDASREHCRCLLIKTSSPAARPTPTSNSGAARSAILRLWTARSISLADKARSISPVNNPFRPARGSSGSAVRSSPCVLMILTVVSSSGHARFSASATIAVCLRASSLPRDPRMSFSTRWPTIRKPASRHRPGHAAPPAVSAYRYRSRSARRNRRHVRR